MKSGRIAEDYRLTGITDPNILSWTLGYNADDDIIGITDNLTSANSQSLGYDALNRLHTGSGNYGSLDYSYDADGNRTQLNVNGVLTNYTYGATNNRLTKVNAIARSYDADGSTTHDGTYVYAYDDSERLSGITETGLTASALYNGLGQRAEKTVNGTTTVFIYDESGHLIGEYTPSGTLIAEHIWLNNQPVGVITPADLYYVQTDQLNTPRAITNASKAIVWQWSSDPFGTGAPTGSLTYNLRFPGQYYDAETGHSYNGHRDYDALTGRYIESDPIGIHGGINTYAYVMSNPLGLMDPLGFDWKFTSWNLTGWQGHRWWIQWRVLSAICYETCHHVYQRVEAKYEQRGIFTVNYEDMPENDAFDQMQDQDTNDAASEATNVLADLLEAQVKAREDGSMTEIEKMMSDPANGNKFCSSLTTPPKQNAQCCNNK